MVKKSNDKPKQVKFAKENSKGAGKNAKKPSHPPSSEMVLEAIAALKDRKGTTLQAIKKYITTAYRLDISKQAFYIKKYLKSAVEKKEIVQTKGSGASGRFRLPTKADARREKEKNMPKKPPSKKQAAVKPTGATKKSDAGKKPAKEVNERGKPKTPKSVVKRKGEKPNGGMSIRKRASKTQNSK